MKERMNKYTGKRCIVIWTFYFNVQVINTMHHVQRSTNKVTEKCFMF